MDTTKIIEEVRYLPDIIISPLFKRYSRFIAPLNMDKDKLRSHMLIVFKVLGHMRQNFTSGSLSKFQPICNIPNSNNDLIIRILDDPQFPSTLMNRYLDSSEGKMPEFPTDFEYIIVCQVLFYKCYYHFSFKDPQFISRYNKITSRIHPNASYINGSTIMDMEKLFNNISFQRHRPELYELHELLRSFANESF